MKILLTGASGFIGRNLTEALQADGHQLVCVGRDPQKMRGELNNSDAITFVALDFTEPHSDEQWQPILEHVDVVINAVGILREAGRQTFDLLHTISPIKLFDACVKADVPFIVQISALGADDDARSRYHRSKKLADDHLRTLPIASAIVQPSLVYGIAGTSAALFNQLATLPILPLPSGGTQPIQPIHISDLVAGIVTLISSPLNGTHTLSFVGPEALSLKNYLARLRALLGFKRPALVTPLPLRLVRIAIKAVGKLPGSLLDSETLEMLLRGNVGSSNAITHLLGRAPRPPEKFLNRYEATTSRLTALLSWLLPSLRWSIALVWIWTGIVSFGLYPAQSSYVLLERVGVTGTVAPLLLYGAAAFDLVLGVLTIFLRGPLRSALWATQLLLIVGYTLIITWKLPEFWLHPYGPLIKNLPMLATIGLLWALGDDKESRR